jgi:hypothetical protein
LRLKDALPADRILVRIRGAMFGVLRKCTLANGIKNSAFNLLRSSPGSLQRKAGFFWHFAGY